MLYLLISQFVFADPLPVTPETCSDETDCDESSTCSEKNICEPIRLDPIPSKNNRYITMNMLTKTCPTEDIIFKCEFENKKIVEVCDIGYVRYTYGPKNAPEITLAVLREDVSFDCWKGVGDRGSAMTIPYGDTFYTVGFKWNMNDPQNDTMPPPFLYVKTPKLSIAHECVSTSAIEITRRATMCGDGT